MIIIKNSNGYLSSAAAMIEQISSTKLQIINNIQIQIFKKSPHPFRRGKQVWNLSDCILRFVCILSFVIWDLVGSLE